MTRVEIETSRTPTPAIVAAASELVAAATSPDGERPLSDHLWLDLTHGGGPGFVAVVARAEDADAAGASIVGYAQVARGNAVRPVEVVIAPSVVDRAELTTTMLDAALGAVRADGGGTVQWWSHGGAAADEAIAAAAGMAPARRLLQMRRPLPTGLPADVETRPFRPGIDEAAWLEVNNRAFADHPEQGAWTAATLDQREAEPWFDPAGFRLHERDGRLAAFCWTKRHDELDPVVGEIYVIGVDPDFQGLGLGRQLTLAGLEWIAAQGIGVGMLYVDTSNTAAVGMYERLGFTTHRCDVAYAAAT